MASSIIKYLKSSLKKIHKNLIKFLLRNIPFLHKWMHFLPSNKLVLYNYKSNRYRAKVASIISLTTVLFARYSKSRDVIRKIVTFKSPFFDFNLKLNINEFTQCGYYFDMPNNDLIQLLKLGGNVFIDIGANVGFFSLTASNTFNRVLSFEPTPITLNSLRDNIKLNGFKNIDVFDCALSEKLGSIKLNVNPLNIGGNSLESFSKEIIEQSRRDDWESFDVEVSTLDNILINQDIPIGTIDLIKIDIEGHEVSAIKGAKNTISSHKPLIYAEVTKSRENMEKILQVLPKLYFPFYLQKLEIIRIVEGVDIPLDVLFIPSNKIDKYRQMLKSS
jgi:FkbM family methyltransferase